MKEYKVRAIVMFMNFYKTTIRKFYAWMQRIAESKNAERGLFLMSFSESSFFPIPPPDPLVLMMVFQNTQKWKRVALITTVASVLGGIFGYLLGALLFDSVGVWVRDTLHLAHEFEQVETWYKEYGFMAVLGAALTPVPYKIFTLSAGLFRISLPGFILASIIGRGVRFFAVAGLAKYLGEKHKEKIERYIDLVSLAVLGIAVLAFFLLK